MKNLLVLSFGLIFICNVGNAQDFGYRPILRPALTGNPYLDAQFEREHSQYQQQYQQQTRVTYRKITAVAKSGASHPLRIKYVGDQMQSVECFDTVLQQWSDCYCSKCSGYSMDDRYEGAYDYKAQSIFRGEIYYFNL